MITKFTIYYICTEVSNYWWSDASYTEKNVGTGIQREEKGKAGRKVRREAGREAGGKRARKGEGNLDGSGEESRKEWRGSS
jgi:hypothetical protein